MATRKSNIVDAAGRPIEVSVLEQQQIDEPSLSGLNSRFPDNPSSGLTPRKLASIMKDAVKGDLRAQAELGQDMEEKDPHIFSELQKRKLAVQSAPWQIVPPVNASKQEIKAAEMVTERLASLDMADVIMDMADAILKSYSCSTIQWQLIDGIQTPISVNYVPASHFTVSENDRNQLRLINDQGGSDEMWAGGWIVHHHKSMSSGWIGRNGLVRTLAWPFLFKNYSLRDFAEFLEIYGLPLRLGKYPSGATNEEKRRLLQAVVEIGHNAAGIIPDSMLLEFQNAAQGQADPFMHMIKWAEATISKAVLGGTLTSSSEGGGAYALGNVHNEVRHDIRDADLRQIANTLTRDLIWPMVQFNVGGFGGFHRCPKFEFDTTEPEDIKVLSEALPSLQQLGMNISKNWLHDKTQIPQPEDDDDVLNPQAEEPAPSEKAALTNHVSGCQCSGCQGAALTNQPINNSVPEQIAQQLQDDVLEPEFLQQLRTLVGNAQSFEQIRGGLLLLADADMSKVENLLQQAMVLAEMQGRNDILDQALNDS